MEYIINYEFKNEDNTETLRKELVNLGATKAYEFCWYLTSELTAKEIFDKISSVVSFTGESFHISELNNNNSARVN